MVGQCLHGQPEAAWGSLHRSGNGGTRSNPIWAASTHACTATTCSTAAPPPHVHLGVATGDRKWPARFWVQWQQGDRSPSRVKPQISSVRRRPTNLFGGGERGSRGECFTLGGGSGVHRSWPERPGSGGDPVSPVSSRGEREESEGAGLDRLTDPDPSRVGLTEPGGLVRLVGPIGPNGPRPFV
jgi:hypothetical protein